MPSPACDFCRLPIPRARPRADSAASAEPLYCCYGCQLAAQITRARGEAGQVNWMLTRLGISVFLSMTVMMFSMYLYRQQFADPADLAASPIANQLAGLMRYLCLLFATPVFFMLGLPILSAAIQQARRGLLSTDALVVTGVAAAYVYSYVSTLADHGNTYYETGCVVLVFMTLGRWLEAQGKLKASSAVASLESLFPDQVQVDRNGESLSLRPQDIRENDLVLIPAGQRIAADGRIESGLSHVDEQLLTGESTPVARQPGDLVRAGTLAVDGALRIRATAVGAHSTLGRLIDLLDRARRAKSRYEQLADRVSTAFIPVTTALAVVAAVAGARRGGIDEAIMSALAVLLIACPCALGIATPTAVWTALGRAARRQILFRDGPTLESLARVRGVCFDKTGTLTSGLPQVADLFASHRPDERARTLAHAAGLAAGSTHGLSRAIVAYARAGGVEPSAADEVRTLPGRGLSGRIGGVTVLLGNAALMTESGVEIDGGMDAALHRFASDGMPVACIGFDGEVRGAFAFSESLRPEAPRAVTELRGLGVQVAVLTGDHAARAQALADELGVDVFAALRPEDKVDHVRAFRVFKGHVAMIGDGLNDAPALAAADVGIAMACGADLTRDAAAVCLLGDDLTAVPWAIHLARRTVRTIKLNLFWAFAYNVVGIALAVRGDLTPIFAAAAMVVSSILVITNSLRLASVGWVIDPPAVRGKTLGVVDGHGLAQRDIATEAVLPTGTGGSMTHPTDSFPQSKIQNPKSKIAPEVHP